MASARVIIGTLDHRRKPSLSIRISADSRRGDLHVHWRGDQLFEGAPTTAIATGWGSTLVANHPHSDVPSHLLQPRITSFISATRPLGRCSTAMLRCRSNTRSNALQMALQPVFQTAVTLLFTDAYLVASSPGSIGTVRRDAETRSFRCYNHFHRWRESSKS